MPKRKCEPEEELPRYDSIPDVDASKEEGGEALLRSKSGRTKKVKKEIVTSREPTPRQTLPDSHFKIISWNGTNIILDN